MKSSRTKKLAAGGVAAFTILGGSIAVAALNPFGLAAAQTNTPTTTVPTAPAAPNGAGTFKSNEDPTHEATESSAREAAEDSGQVGGRHHGGSNEDPTHEAGESAAREAAEDQNATTAPTTPATPAPSTSSATNSSLRF